MFRTPDPRLEEVADRIYAYVQPPGGWCVSNSGVLVGPDGVTLVDTTATLPRARALHGALAGLTPLPTRLVVNTHFHGDHTFGNQVFAEDAVIVGHEECREVMIEGGTVMTYLWPDVEWGEIEISPPSLTFADHLTVHSGDLRVELIHPGVAHTTGDVVVWVPDHGVLFAGDIVFNGGTPFVLAGSVSGTLAALDRLRALGATTIVPGHGDVGGPELYDATEAYLRWLQGVAREGMAAGLTPLEAARETDLGEWAGLLEPERIVGNLFRAYSEERDEPPGVPIDHLVAFGDMIAYNGGQVPACLA
ncbi:MBL fold metallo-hydrolase [Actinomadura craniellae]|uniref:MBL fold metallo-hydrolase n=1 Tax=Actinomadura craniellae TaxID=2231787 RepID=A0A365H0I7_9ACTN|nr:MBL fold metallo-hydrolase [Actinomadura craniellae]RAY11713.1 MBL fold metallo-hydrolase [Actinomadura craniellae]